MCATKANTSESGTSPLARHRVRDGIQHLILSGEYQPGQRLVQQELASRFGVAQSVVRESLLELQFGGLVEAVDNLGMFVSGLDAELLVSAYEIREMFEGLAARLCCERAGRSDLRDLLELAEENFRHGSQGDLEAMSLLDRRFHSRIVQISRNPLLVRLTEGYRVLGMFVRANRNITQVHDEHLEIVRTIEANQPEIAERLAREHVRAARAAIQRSAGEGNKLVPGWADDSEQGQG